MQFFLGDPQGYRGPEIAYAGGAEGLRADAEAAGVDLYVHAPYIVNVATTNNRIRIPSRKLLQQHVDAAASIGAKGLIVHGGHVNKTDEPREGLRQLAQGRRGHRPQGPAAHREHRRRRQRHDPLPRADRPGLGRDRRAPSRPTGSGFCLDTCHAHAGGNDLETVVDDVRRITGRIDLVHCNDSRDDVRLRRRPARELRGRHDRPRAAGGGRPRRRRPGRVRDAGRCRRALRRLRLAARALCGPPAVTPRRTDR